MLRAVLVSAAALAGGLRFPTATEVKVALWIFALLLLLCTTWVGRHYRIRTAPSDRGPSSEPPAPPWWVLIRGVSFPAPDVATLRKWAAEGRFSRDDLVWNADRTQWIAARNVDELRSQFYPPFVTRWRYDAFLAVWPLYFVILGLAGAVAVFASLGMGLLSAVDALRWQSADGTIIRSTVSEENIASFGPPVFNYRPSIRYQYRVSGRLYTSARRDFAQDAASDIYPDRARAEAITAIFPVNDRVIVYFDPRAPSNATLDRCEGTMVAFVVGMVMLALALFVLHAWWRRRPASPAPA